MDRIELTPREIEYINKYKRFLESEHKLIEEAQQRAAQWQQVAHGVCLLAIDRAGGDASQGEWTVQGNALVRVEKLSPE
jgi:hypothetical protein